MGRKIQFVFCTCILLSVSFPIQARAGYYENHVDRGDYCMQAKDVCITDMQRAAWLEDGTLTEKLIEKSGVFVSQFHPSDSTRYWSEYDGTYEIDIEALKDLAFQDGKTSVTVPVMFHLSGIEEAFITIHVKVTASEQDLSDGRDTANTEQADDSGQKPGILKTDETPEKGREAERSQKVLENPEDMNSGSALGQGVQKDCRWRFVWPIMIILAILGFGGSLYSDFKVLRKYKQKREEREGRE